MMLKLDVPAGILKSLFLKLMGAKMTRTQY
jgi:hypothetical protein